MTQLYKLKKEARQFFRDLEDKVKDAKWWRENVVSENLLDPVSNVHIRYGKKVSECGTSLKGWNGEKNEATFEFTIVVNEMTNKDCEKVAIPYVMDEIQKVLDKIFKP